MPNSIRNQTVWTGPTGSLATYNVSPNSANLPAVSPYVLGQLGYSVESNGSVYTFVVLDSGSAVGYTANQLLYWRNKSTKTVTNDITRATGGRNAPAGVLQVASTAGNYVAMIIAGYNIPVQATGTIAAGDFLIANSTNGVVTNSAAGTAPGYFTVGMALGAVANGLVNADLDIQQLY